MADGIPEEPTSSSKSEGRALSDEGGTVTVEKTRLEKFLAISNVLSIWVTIIGLVVAGVWTLKEYRDYQDDQRIDRIFEFAKRAENTLISDARKTVFLTWNESRRELISLISPKSKKSPEDLEVLLTKFTLELIRDKIRFEVLTLADFYNGLAICVRRNLCNKQIAYDYFGREMLSFKNLHLSFISMLQRDKNWRDPTFGQDLIDFTRSYRKYLDNLQRQQLPMVQVTFSQVLLSCALYRQEASPYFDLTPINSMTACGYTRTQAQLPSHGRKSPTSRHQGRFPASPRGHVTDLQVTDLLGRWWFGAGR